MQPLPGPQEVALHGFPVELPVVVDFHRLDGVGPVHEDDLGRSAAVEQLCALQGADVAEKLGDVVLRHRRLEVRDHHLGALMRIKTLVTEF